MDFNMAVLRSEALGITLVFACFVLGHLSGAAAHSMQERTYDLPTKDIFKEANILQCDTPRVGFRTLPPYPRPDWSVYTKIDEQTQRIYDVVSENKKEMHIQKLYSEGAAFKNASYLNETYSADVELVVYERGGLSSDTLEAINNIGSDELVREWRRDNSIEEWSTNSDRIKPIPRRRPTDGKLRVSFIFGEHGREIITTEMGEYFIRVLKDASVETLLPIFDNDTRLVGDVLEALDNTVVHIVPCENKNGRRIMETPDEPYVVRSNLCQRGNGRNIDPNRNWPYMWGNKPTDYMPRQEYPGPEPLSEPEARLMFRIFHAVEPLAGVNVHSGMHGLFMPPDFSPIMINSANTLAQLRLLKRSDDKWIDSLNSIGGGGATVGYVAYGTHNDFVRKGFQVESTQTWEIYGNEDAPGSDCFSMFNPLGEGEVKDYVRKWTGFALEHISNLYKGLVPGIRSPDGAFSQEVAELPDPKACGLTPSHLDVMHALSDIALGRGDKSERRAFVEDTIRKTPTLELPTLDEKSAKVREAFEGIYDNASSASYLSYDKQPLVSETASSFIHNSPSNFESASANRNHSGSTHAKTGVRNDTKGATLMMRSYSIMLFGLVLLTITAILWQRRTRRGGRRLGTKRRHFRGVDVV